MHKVILKRAGLNTAIFKSNTPAEARPRNWSPRLSAKLWHLCDMHHEDFMRVAIEEARIAYAAGEVPVGAVAVADGGVVARAHNIREATGNPLGHAEVLLLQGLARNEGRRTPRHASGSKDEGRIVYRLSERSERSSIVHRPSWRLDDVTIYVTLEPCLMCMGAMLQVRIPRLVYGCHDPKAGACGSLYDLSNDSRLNHRIDVVSGVLEEECGELLSEFFKGLRR